MNEGRTSEGTPLDSLAEEILGLLRGCPEAGEIVLGGYFALRRYVDYRSTHDLDAWWRTGRTSAAVACIEGAMREVAERHGLAYARREWGETLSFELSDDRRKVFSFQIAVRSVELEPPLRSEWDPLLVEGLADNVGSKMNALVQRGAPRDFLDVRELVTRGIVSVEQCWAWWVGKNPATDEHQARAHALRHLEALEQRRPLHQIEDLRERDAARSARAWIRHTLLEVPGDAGA